MKTDQRKGLFIRKWRHDISNWKVKTWNCSYKNRSIAHVASSTQCFATRSTSATCLPKLRNERCWNCAILCTWLQKLHKYEQQKWQFWEELIFMRRSHSPPGGNDCCENDFREIHTWGWSGSRDFYTAKIMQIHIYTNIFSGRNLLTGIKIYLLGFPFYITSIQIS